jgi:organic hydroperoxide reductase OsmC/OhrA
MSEHTFTASLSWKRTTPDFAYDSYDRGHDVVFGSGTSLSMTAAPAFKGDPRKVNPEEQLVAALSSCHMLTFLAIAARKRLIVDAYDDDAAGVLDKNAAGKLAVTRVTLRPRVVFSGDKIPSADDVRALHERSHGECFIANSVLTQVLIEPR